jgi:acyl-homoserine lactone acylase PvdQ
MGYVFNLAKALTGFARATTMEQFGEHVELLAVSQHNRYADREGNIAYWMSGRDPVRPPQVSSTIMIGSQTLTIWMPRKLRTILSSLHWTR